MKVYLHYQIFTLPKQLILSCASISCKIHQLVPSSFNFPLSKHFRFLHGQLWLGCRTWVEVLGRIPHISSTKIYQYYHSWNPISQGIFFSFINDYCPSLLLLWDEDSLIIIPKRKRFSPNISTQILCNFCWGPLFKITYLGVFHSQLHISNLESYWGWTDINV